MIRNICEVSTRVWYKHDALGVKRSDNEFSYKLSSERPIGVSCQYLLGEVLSHPKTACRLSIGSSFAAGLPKK